MKMIVYSLFAAVLIFADVCRAQPTTDEIRVISDQIWQADGNRINGNDVQYNINGAKLFTYVNEARFTGTYSRFIALMSHYNPDHGIPDNCGTACQNAQNAFLDDILQTRPMQLLHNWLFGKGLASQTTAGFRTELRQYFFLPYTRSGGPLDSSGFEHVFLGEIKRSPREVTGFHNWVKLYFAEKSGDFKYGPYQRTCPNEVLAFGFDYLSAKKPISSLFIRTSPEVEVALYTLCLLTRVGTGCPVRRNGANLTMTVWDMTGLPKTVGSAYPNC
jgi:poly(U)-specific endoribonuclease